MTSAATGTVPKPGSLDAASRVVAAGLVCGFLAIIQSSGFGLFILGGGSHALAPMAIGMAIFATAATTAVAAMTSSVPGVVSIAQTVPIAALTPGVAYILATTANDAASPAPAATVVAFVALAAVAVGVVAVLLGGFRYGRFIRFVPYPVVAGFFAGCGWLIMLGGIGVAVGSRIGPTHLDLLADPSVQFRLVVTVVLVVLALIPSRRFPVSLVLPGLAAAVIVIYNAVALAIGFVPAAARADGWLVTFTGQGPLWPPVALGDLSLIDWPAIGGALVYLPVVVVLSIITVLMNESAIELAARRDMDLDHELRSVGLQNLVGGAGGGLPGFHSVPLTLLAARLKASHAGVGLIVAALCVAALVFGDVVLAVVPTPLLAGLVVWVGLSLVIDWLLRSYARLPVWEYLVVVLIFIAIITVGFVWGLLAGLIAAAVLFVVEYGRVEIVRHVLTGRDYQSGNDSSEARRSALQAAGDAILIVRLQGFLFFGTADRMRRRIQHHIDQPEGAPIRYLVVDFRRVSGLDSSTVMSFTRLAQNTGRDGFTLVFCGMTDAVGSAMARGGFTPDPDSHVRFLGDLDHGLEWCENDLLAAVAPGIVANAPVPVIDLLVAVMKDQRHAESLLPYLERIEIGTGATLIEQGAPSNDVFFVEAGRAAVMLAAGKDRVRLATVGQGSIVGEMAFYLGKERSASVIAEAPLIAWRLSAESLARLEAESPEALICFHRGMAALLADRLAGANRLVRLLAD